VVKPCPSVFRRRRPGIYPTWELANAQVNGFPGNMHRRFPSFEAGYEALVAYVDGLGRPGTFREATHGGGHGASNESSPMRNKASRSSPGSDSHRGVASSSEAREEVNENTREGFEMGNMVEAIAALEGSVSQLEVDKWEFMMAVVEAFQQVAESLTRGERRN
ncbi:hypothetical protein PIB30_063315, partial [Stylosanthes scabra]|nr:hypothetical protein [Stylosanthes scabra]